MNSIILIGRAVNGGTTGRRNRLNTVISACVVLAAAWAGHAAGATADRLMPVSVTASADDGNVAANTLDGSLATRWSASGDGQWISFDLGAPVSVGSVQIAWYKGNLRSTRFDVQTSAIGTDWNTVFAGQSSGTGTNLETYDLTDSIARYVRITGHGNTLDAWNSIAELNAYGPGDVSAPPGLRLTASRGSSAASGPVIDLWNGVAGTIYQVQVSSNLVTWADASYAFTNAGAVQSWQEDFSRLPASARKLRYYRVKQIATAPVTNTSPPTIAKAYAKLPLGAKKMAYWRNRPIDQYDSRVTRAIMVIHGAGANAEGYFDRINGDLDTDCGAEWQGPFRYQRAHIFKAFMDRYYPGNHFKLSDVPGVDHDSTRMFASPQGVNAIFFAD